ncbi:hypothetical protein [Aeromonas hydrophila]|uniref:hypothetical protein n=1 Tax=Aeromonas hydrophila TaxID=644 RepID=UPI001118589B|nr:hypothetical protein [Aeromonas hydrophila]
MTTAEQEGCTTEMVLMADIAATKLIFQVKKEALRQFQNQLITLRKEQKPNTNVYAIRALLLACRRERSWMNVALDQIEFDKQVIDEIHQIRASEQSGMQEDSIQ